MELDSSSPNTGLPAGGRRHCGCWRVISLVLTEHRGNGVLVHPVYQGPEQKHSELTMIGPFNSLIKNCREAGCLGNQGASKMSNVVVQINLLTRNEHCLGRETLIRERYQPACSPWHAILGSSCKRGRRVRDGCVTVVATLRFNFSRATGCFLQESIHQMGTRHEMSLVPRYGY